MNLVISAYLSSLLVFSAVSPALSLAESKGDLAVVESFIDEERPALLSQALYVALPKESRGQYQEHIAPSPVESSPTVHPSTALVEQRIREIFNTKIDQKPTMPIIDDHQIFKVQRTPDGKLSVVYNNTHITPYDSENDQDNGGTTKNNNNRHSQSVRDVVFPTEKPVMSLSGLKPKCAQNTKHFCTEVENYPTALLQSILVAESSKYEQLFGDDVIPPPPINLTQRIDAPGEEPLCQSAERVVYPQAGLTKDNNWAIIVNQRDFHQGIRVEECSNTGSQCAMTGSFPIGYTTECIQKYIMRQLVSVNEDGQIAKDLFKVPSCCKCVVRSSQRFRREISRKNSLRKK